LELFLGAGTRLPGFFAMCDNLSAIAILRRFGEVFIVVFRVGWVEALRNPTYDFWFDDNI